jgi:hypothetical protein
VKISDVRKQATVNESTISNASTAGVNLNGAGASSDEYVVKDNTFEDNGDGLRVSDSVGNNPFDNAIHFNVFESNDEGIYVNEGDFDGPINAQFNEFIDNNNNGLKVDGIDADGDTANANVTANYSYWGDREYSRIISTYSPQNTRLVDGQVRSVYEYTRIHTEGRR